MTESSSQSGDAPNNEFEPTTEIPSVPAPEEPRGTPISKTMVAIAAIVGLVAGIFGTSLVLLVRASVSDNNTTTISASSDSKGVPAGATEQVAAKLLPSVVQISVTNSNEAGTGSGVVLDTDGDILTNNHVVSVAANGGALSASFSDGTTVPATVVGTDPVTDLAVIKVNGVNGLKPATIGHSNNLRVGQAVVAVGSPFGLSATVTSGIVSALNRPVSVTDESQNQQNPFQPQQQPATSTIYPAIQTDAAINPGNSGGPLVDMNGQVVGINSSIRTSSGTGGSIGLGFSIPIDEALPVVNQILHHETPTHARLGVTVGQLDSNSLQKGAVVKGLDAAGVGAKAGLQNGDIITKVDDQVVDSADGLVATIRGHRPGDTVKVTYIRAGKATTISITLGSDASTKAS